MIRMSDSEYLHATSPSVYPSIPLLSFFKQKDPGSRAICCRDLLRFYSPGMPAAIILFDELLDFITLKHFHQFLDVVAVLVSFTYSNQIGVWRITVLQCD